ncbi:MAG: DUF1553 domain-containing protein [Bacteroidota bacterium]
MNIQSNKIILFLSFGLTLLAVLAIGGFSFSQEEKIDFNQDIRPILSDRCFSCHGPDKEGRKADLRLDTPEGAREHLLESGKRAFVPKNHKASEGLQRMLSKDPELQMPPPESQLSLLPEEIELISKWIDQGAPYDPHWSFISPIQVEPPEESKDNWSRNAIDRFIFSGLAKAQIQPQPEAQKESLIRRVSFDLTGLAPTMDEIDQFLKDSSELAYENFVDRLLASEAYGEHMAVSWMDLARYADTYGYTVDRYRPAWPWRDWVIQAFNENMPYDQFVTWQLAGDLIDNRSHEQRIATAFNRNHSQNAEGGIVNEEFRVEYVSDRTHTFGTAFLGLTMECARCHDHKYDPISQKDYYQLFSYFNQVDESGQITFSTKDMPAPTMFLPDEATAEKMAFLKQAIEKQKDTLNEAAQTLLATKEYTQWVAKNPGPFGGNREEVAYFSLNEATNGKLRNRIQNRLMGRVIDPVTGREVGQIPPLVPGKKGRGMLLNGDDALDFPGVGKFGKSDPFSIGLWVNIPEALNTGVVFHSNRGGIIFNFKGYQVSLEDNRWDVRLAHAFPYNAIHLVSEEEIKKDTWIHVMLTYDGSSEANGVNLYVDGERVAMLVEQDQLYKDIVFHRENMDTHLKVGARWRSSGLRGAKVDEIVVYDRTLHPLEVKSLVDKQFVNTEIDKASGLFSDYHEFLFLRTSPNYQEKLRELAELRKKWDLLTEEVPELMVIEEREKYRPTFVLNRGEYSSPTEEVFPSPPTALSKGVNGFATNRMGLTQWLFDPTNPLTARVVVNRLWQQFFGQGLVKTAEDFGNQGTLPTYPKLLDYLAVDLVDSGWDIKALLRKIVLSATYRQGSDADSVLIERDPENQLLGRGPVARLSAEMLRDHMLSSSGLLHRKIGGPSVKPYQPEGLWRVNTGTYEPDSGNNLYRRSLYTFWKRTIPPPNMNTFDAPSRSYCLVRRQKTNTPLQALTLLNDPQFQEAARVLGQNVLEKGMSPKEGITYMFRNFTSRFPSLEEQTALVELYLEQREVFQDSPQKAKGWIEVGKYPLPKAYETADLAAYAVTASTLMNYYESLYK